MQKQHNHRFRMKGSLGHMMGAGGELFDRYQAPTNRLKLYVRALSSTGSILSNTDLSDLSTVGTCDIFVYQMRHRVM